MINSNTLSEKNINRPISPDTLAKLLSGVEFIFPEHRKKVFEILLEIKATPREISDPRAEKIIFDLNKKLVKLLKLSDKKIEKHTFEVANDEKYWLIEEVA